MPPRLAVPRHSPFSTSSSKMENSRRFVPTQSKSTAPSTPNSTLRVLPTPPATETPVFRLAPAGNAVDSSLQRSDTRPGTAQSKNRPVVAPKLNIGRFKQNKTQKNGSHGDNRATRSPAHPPKSFPQAQVQSANDDEVQNTRASTIFGRQTGLLPPLTRQFSPTSPGPMPPPAQPSNSRFSSPVSSIAEDDTTGNGGENTLGGHQANLSDSEAHTSALNALGQPRVTMDAHAPHQQRAFQRRAAASHDDTRVSAHEGDFDEPEVESPSPAAFSKRRTEDHDAHVSAKRPRSRYDSGVTDYSSQEQVRQEPPAATPHPQTVFSTSLDAYINSHHGEWLAAQKRWEDCTMEEWKNGPTELVAELNKVMDMVSPTFSQSSVGEKTYKIRAQVKDFMMQVPVPKRMEVYAGINKDVDAHKLRLDTRDVMLAKEKERLVKQAGGLAGSFVAN
ncbi:hypothetical protein FRC06_004549 [Ceratobasidium sp. 370]|nr:hypothetical protein FRC06_004549 [Ceratobasidium sp. 370]